MLMTLLIIVVYFCPLEIYINKRVREKKRESMSTRSICHFHGSTIDKLTIILRVLLVDRCVLAPFIKAE